MEEKALSSKNEREEEDIILNKIVCMKKDSLNIEKTEQSQKNFVKTIDSHEFEDYYTMLLNQNNNSADKKDEQVSETSNAKVKHSQDNANYMHQGNDDKYQRAKNDVSYNPYQIDMSNSTSHPSGYEPTTESYYNEAYQMTNDYNHYNNYYDGQDNFSSIEMNKNIIETTKGNNKQEYYTHLNTANFEQEVNSPFNKYNNGFDSFDMCDNAFDNYLLTENVTYHPNPYDYQVFEKDKSTKNYPFNFKKKYSTLLKERNFYEPLVFISDDKELEKKYLKKEEISTKPPYSYSQLITKALESNSENIMTLAEIYAWIKDNYEYYKRSDTTWQNSIRHNLSLNKCFKKMPRPSSKPGKGGFWSIDYDFIANDDTRKLKRRSREGYCREFDDFYRKSIQKVSIHKTQNNYIENESVSDTESNKKNEFDYFVKYRK